MIDPNPSTFTQQQIKREMTTLGRYYSLRGKSPIAVPSVTTVLGNVMNKGYSFDCVEKLKNGETLSFGEIKDIVFRYCNTIDIAMSGGKSVLLRSVCMYIESYMAYYEENKPLLIACEYQMYSKSLGFAGTADEVCEIGTLAQRTILDIKTGSQQESHIIQGNAYAMLWNELNPDFKVNHVAVLYLKDSFKLKPTYSLKMEQVDTRMWEDILAVYKNKYMLKDGGYKQKSKWNPRVQFNLIKEIADVRLDGVEI